MEVILIHDVENLGLKGDVVDVKRGYARNFLLPRRLAETATPGRVAEIRRVEVERARHEARSAEQAADIAATLQKTVLRFEVKAGPTGALFGSVTATDVAEELWRTRWAFTQEKVHGRPIIDLQEDGRRIRDSVVPPTWTVRMRLDLWGVAPRLSSTREARDGAGRPTHLEQREFDYAGRAGRVTTTDLATGEVDVQSVRLSLQSVTGELLPAALRLLPAAPDGRLRLDLVTRGGTVIGLQAKMAGRERLASLK